MNMNIGDLLFQLISFLLLLAIISIIVLFIKKGFTTQSRLKQLEEKVEQLSKEKRSERP